jgi:POT family proton-dependent oligopeptide transporter
VTQSTGTDVKVGAEAGPQKGGFFSRHPVGFWFFFWGELAERSSYYGMRAILALYMTDRLGFTDGRASMWMSYFIAACYFLPLVGGYLADNYFGKYRTIVGFSIPRMTWPRM